ncbi:MAG TPA: hypothetical protein DDW29_04535, partial [Gammaproteobacteria bacterium]|nr:hypothetical protein [Gammaproteobacteria bacterium]
MSNITPTTTRSNTNLELGRIGSLQDCSICIEPKDPQDTTNKLIKIENCGHDFHESCLANWHNSNNQNSSNCPECRQPIGFLPRLAAIGTTIAQPVVQEIPLAGNYLAQQLFSQHQQAST